MKLNDKDQSAYGKIKEALATASHFIIASPLKLPPKVVAVAKCVALALGVLEAVENGINKKEGDGNENE